jgi:hypothetical protein
MVGSKYFSIPIVHLSFSRFLLIALRNPMAKRHTLSAVVAILALIQSALGVLRAFHWFNVGSDLMGKGILILPLVGMVAYARGALVVAIGLLYVFFAFALLTLRRSARPIGLVAAIVNLLLALSVAIQGESLFQVLVWSIVPGIVLWYLFGRVGGQLKGQK